MTARQSLLRTTTWRCARMPSVVLIVAAFVLLQAANATVTSIMTLFVTETMRINVIWAGIALGVAPRLEVPPWS
jgi:MFS transporter, SET family, sugar efflux transporter